MLVWVDIHDILKHDTNKHKSVSQKKHLHSKLEERSREKSEHKKKK